MTSSIPPIAHFVWFGRTFPWLNWLAVRSAADRGGYERVILHHADSLEGLPYFRELVRDPRVECAPLDFTALLERVRKVAPGIMEVAGRISDRPAMKSDLARMALLWLHGGVYLDMDTVSLEPLDDLREAGGFFCAMERLVWPKAVRASRNPLVLGAATLRSLTRDLLRRHPRGWQYFRRIERFFPLAVNGAVLGAAPGHPFLAELLSRAGALTPEDLARSRDSVGPDLLQDTLRAFGAGSVRVLPPEVFFPLGPEISEHWFRVCPAGTLPLLKEVLYPGTRVVHWYASVRAKGIIPIFDAAYARANHDRQLLSALSEPWVGSGH